MGLNSESPLNVFIAEGKEESKQTKSTGERERSSLHCELGVRDIGTDCFSLLLRTLQVGIVGVLEVLHRHPVLASHEGVCFGLQLFCCSLRQILSLSHNTLI